jgi:hypothetical protein
MGETDIMNKGFLTKGRPQRKTSSQPANNSKAESVRSRRNNENQKKSANKVLRTQTMTATVPPVMVRGGAYGIPLVHRAPTHPRRQSCSGPSRYQTRMAHTFKFPCDVVWDDDNYCFCNP